MIDRPRRLRQSAAMRALVAETRVHPSDLMLPIFIKEGLEHPKPITGMPGVFQNTELGFLDSCQQALDQGIKSVMLFAIPLITDEIGSEAYNPAGVLTKAVRAAKARFGDELVIVADLCLDEFTSHGHCGVLDSKGYVDNDETLKLYQKMAVVLADAGADLLGLSGMMDNQVASVREALDHNNHNTGIMAYAAKYASSFYGPFRNAVESNLEGNRKSYQQDYRNRLEASNEIQLDLAQGADLIMVKPALSYLDIISDASAISNKPVAAYLVSGELAMIEAASQQGWINREAAIAEAVHSIKRAGASIICTYWAIEIAKAINNDEY